MKPIVQCWVGYMMLMQYADPGWKSQTSKQVDNVIRDLTQQDGGGTSEH